MERPEAAIDKMLRLIDLEKGAEVEETSRLLERLSGPQLEARGVSLLRLQVVEEEAGWGGRVLVSLERGTGEILPASRIQPGDIVRLVPHDPSGSGRGKRQDDRCPSGVVHRRKARRITVALDEIPDDGLPEGLLRLDRVANDVTYRRMRAALERLRAADRGRQKEWRDILLGEREPRLDALRPFKPLDDGLNESQAEAVRLALAARDVALIHGPPGTGKTTTVLEVIRQTAARGERVLATAPSNVAVDNLTEGLARRGARVVRLGHPARLLPSVLEQSLEALVAAHPHTRIAADLRRQLLGALKRAQREKDRGRRRERWGEVRSLRREIAAIEEGAARAVLDSAEVVLATCAGSADEVLAEREFDLVVVDEAAQCLEPLSWIPILAGKRLVLAGDHRQLPPTIISRAAADGGLAVTLFERLMERYGEAAAPRLSRILTTQYRMHRAIMEYPSLRLYGGQLIAAPAVEGHLLAGLEGVEKAEATEAPLLFIDTAGCGYEEETEAEGESKQNPLEAEAAARHAEALLAAGVPAARLGVITPYSAQVRLLRERLAAAGEDLEIDTVDGFQGREKEAIIISLVRSNDRGEVGFLGEVRRINVALTRARRHLAVVGDSGTVARDPFISGFIEYCEKLGAHRSAWELGLGGL